MKLLGVYIDENLTFAGHISELCTIASQKLGMFVRLRNFIPCNAKSQTETYEELLTRAKLSTLYNRRLQDIAILMCKIRYRMAHRCVSELLTIKRTHQSLRNCDFELPRFDIVAYGKHSLRYQ